MEGLSSQQHWYAIHTKPNQEQLAEASLAQLDLEVFLPRIKRERLVAGHWRSVRQALFPGYLFSRFSLALSLNPVRYARGVFKVLSAGNVPIALEAQLIAGIQERVNEDGYVELLAPTFRTGDRVAIDDGPFAGWVGRFEREWDDGKRVLILLEAIHQARVLVNRRCLVPANS